MRVQHRERVKLSLLLLLLLLASPVLFSPILFACFYCFCHSFCAIKFREETLAAQISFAAQHGKITGTSKTGRM